MSACCKQYRVDVDRCMWVILTQCQSEMLTAQHNCHRHIRFFSSSTFFNYISYVHITTSAPISLITTSQENASICKKQFFLLVGAVCLWLGFDYVEIVWKIIVVQILFHSYLARWNRKYQRMRKKFSCWSRGASFTETADAKFVLGFYAENTFRTTKAHLFYRQTSSRARTSGFLLLCNFYI